MIRMLDCWIDLYRLTGFFITRQVEFKKTTLQSKIYQIQGWKMFSGRNADTT